MLILDKPAGIAVHRGPKAAAGDVNLEQFFGQLTFGLPRPPALAHRLDKRVLKKAFAAYLEALGRLIGDKG